LYQVEWQRVPKSRRPRMGWGSEGRSGGSGAGGGGRGGSKGQSDNRGGGFRDAPKGGSSKGSGKDSSKDGSKGDSKGSGKGKKGRAAPWSFIPLCEETDPLGLWELSQKIPDQWVDQQHGGKMSREKLHVTFLLKMTQGVEHLLRLEDICGSANPVQLQVSDLFLSHVERIRDAEVYCIGVAFSSPELKALKEQWLQEEDDRNRRTHDPYPSSDGHVSLAYVHADVWDDAKDFVDANRGVVQGKNFTVTAITYADENRDQMRLKLAGTSDETDTRSNKTRKGPTSATKVAALEIDGSVMEGGGQILRNSVAYSAILGYPVRITKIRAGRKTPGLQPQHLESFRLVRDVVSAAFEGDTVGSCGVCFRPGKLREGTFSADPKTAGAVTLMVQAAIAPLAFCSDTSEVQVHGGTDVGFSPPFDFLQRVLAPTVESMGISIEMTCKMRGFFPKGGGHVSLFVTGPKGPLKAVSIAERGHVTKIEAICFATPDDGWLDDQEVLAVESEFGPWLRDELADKGSAAKAPQVEVHCQADSPPFARTNFACCEIVVKTSTGGIFHGSAGAVEVSRNKSLYEVWGMTAEKALGPLKAQLKSGSALDEHLLDQLILPASLAQGTSRLLGGKELTLHAQTAIHIAEKMVPGVKFSITNPTPSTTLVECHGIGRRPGSAPMNPAQHNADSSQPGDLVALVSAGSLINVEQDVVASLCNDLDVFSQRNAVDACAKVAEDCFVIQGCTGPDQAVALRVELEQLLSFYGISHVSWL